MNVYHHENIWASFTVTFHISDTFVVRALQVASRLFGVSVLGCLRSSEMRTAPL